MTDYAHPMDDDGSELESEERTFQASSQKLLGNLFVLLKIALVHDMDNRAVIPAVKRFRMSLSEFTRGVSPTAAIQFVGDAVYCNKRLVRADLETWNKSRFVKDFFAKLSVAEVAFENDCPERSLRDFIAAARQVSLDPAEAGNVRSRQFAGISFRDLHAKGVDMNDEILVLPDPVRVLRAFGVIVVTLRELLEEVKQGRRFSLLPLRRSMQEFVRLPAHTHSLQLGLLSLEQFRNEISGRLARIGIMVVVMGRRMGLGISILRDLGVTAALSGVGRIFDDELAVAPAELCVERDVYRKGARLLMGHSGQGRAASLRVIAAAEMGDKDSWRTGHPLSCLLAVAEAYEHRTAKPPIGQGMRPDQALQSILDDEEYDTPAARTLIATIGLFPVGSMVKLSTGETAVVVEGPTSANDAAQPQVLVITDAEGRAGHSRPVNLSEAQVSIAGTMDATDLDLNVGHFLFA